MATVFTCTTPKDGWSLYHHFLGNELLIIASRQDDENDEEQKVKDERVTSDTWARLVGNLYMIMRRMQNNNHHEDASKMQQIIDMAVESDLTDSKVREAIHAKNKELNANAAEFDALVKRLAAKHGK